MMMAQINGGAERF